MIGGVAIGAGSGPTYYRMFNAVIASITIAGLWLINTRRVIWGNVPARRLVRVQFTVLIVIVSAGLIVAQWAVFQSWR